MSFEDIQSRNEIQSCRQLDGFTDVGSNSTWVARDSRSAEWSILCRYYSSSANKPVLAVDYISSLLIHGQVDDTKHWHCRRHLSTQLCCCCTRVQCVRIEHSGVTAVTTHAAAVAYGSRRLPFILVRHSWLCSIITLILSAVLTIESARVHSQNFIHCNLADSVCSYKC